MDLGSTSKEIADHLAVKGIKGYPKDPCQCPIAKYIRTMFPDYDVEVNINDSNFVCVEVYSHKDSMIELVAVDPCVESFVNDFDAGRFPMLVKTDFD